MAENAFVKIGTALLKHQVKKLVGDDALIAIGEEVAEIGGDKLDAWLSNSSTRVKIEKAAKSAEASFNDSVGDYELEQWMISMPIGDLPKVLDAVNKLPTSSDEKQLEEEIRNAIAGWRKLPPEKIELAVKSFISCLRSALLPIEKQGQMVIGRAVLRIEERADHIDQRTDKIDKTTQRIEDKLDKAIKPKQDKPITLNTGWYLGQQYGDIDTFTGRDEERKMLTDWLKNEKERLLIIRALGGFGKSALTWEWLNNDVENEKWKTVIWWSFYETGRGFDSFLSETLNNLGIPTEEKQPRQQINELLAAMQKTNILLVLDGFERLLRQYANDGMNAIYTSGTEKETDDIDPSQRACVSLDVDNFLRGLSSEKIKSKILMTTRLTPLVLEGKNRKLLKGFREEKLVEFKPEDAVKYFRNEDINATRAEIIEVSTRYGFHPLSLNLLVGLINEDHNNSGDIIVANQLEIFDDIKANKHHVLEHAYDSLFPERKELLSKISCFRGSIEYNTIKKLFNYPDLEKSLKDLRKRGLLKYADKTRRYDMHPIVRHYAYDRFTDSERKQTHKDLAFHFIDEMPMPNKKVKTLEDLAPVIELYHHMVRAERLDEADKLFYDRLNHPLYFQLCSYQTFIELQSGLISEKTQMPGLKDEIRQGRVLNNIANAYSLSGQPRYAVPFFKKAVLLAEKKDSKINVVTGMGNLAYMAQIPIGAFRDAERNLRQSIDLCREIDDEQIKNINLRELGRLLSYFGNSEGAEQELAISESVFRRIRQPQSQSVSLAYLSLNNLLYHRSKSVNDKDLIQTANNYARQSLELVESGDPNIGGAVALRDLVISRWLLGATYRAKKELTLAEENLSKALELCRQINLVEFEADILLDIARLRYAQGDLKDVQEKAEEALIITERCGYVLQGADVNLFLAQYALEQDGDKIKAKEYAEKAKDLAYCDGGEYKYKVAYDEAERFLKDLGG